jgi:hypothetical protein
MEVTSVAGSRWFVLDGRIVRLLVGVLLAAAGAALFAASASAYGPGYFSATLSGQVAVFSDPGSELGNGAQTEWITTNGGVVGYPNSFDVGGHGWGFNVGGPDNEPLHVGVYDDTGDTPGESTPVLTATRGGEECSGPGRFEIKDLAYDASGAPTRLWLLFELHCGPGWDALFGEVRLGEPPDDPALGSTPSIVRWPADNFGSTETPVPVLFTPSKAMTVSKVALGGNDPSDFRISRDGCTGLDLQSGDDCTAWVNFDPSAAGLKTATLELTDSNGTTHAVPLQGFTYGGATRLVINSDPGDTLTHGQGYSFGAAGDVVWTLGTPQKLEFTATDGSDSFEGVFGPDGGESLSTGGSWDDVADYPSQGGSAGMEITYDHSACGAIDGGFKVVSATYDSYGQMTSIDVAFQQQCRTASGELRGEFQWRAGDNVPPAPWMDPDATGVDASNSSNPVSTTPGNSPGDPTSPTPQPGPSTAEDNRISPGDTGPVTSTAKTTTTATPVKPGASDSPNKASTTPQTRASTLTKQLKRLILTLSRASRQATQATQQTRSPLTRTWLRHARRAIAVLQTTVNTTKRRLQTLTLLPAVATRRAMQRLSVWQTTLRGEQRALSLPGGHNAARVTPLTNQSNRQAAAAIRALKVLGRLAKP